MKVGVARLCLSVILSVKKLFFHVLLGFSNFKWIKLQYRNLSDFSFFVNLVLFVYDLCICDVLMSSYVFYL